MIGCGVGRISMTIWSVYTDEREEERGWEKGADTRSVHGDIHDTAGWQDDEMNRQYPVAPVVSARYR